MDKENMIELLEDFIDFLKEKEDEAAEDASKADKDADDDADFDDAIRQIAKGE